MDNYPRSPRKLQKRSASTSPYPRGPRHSLENVSISDSTLSFGETRTLADETEADDRTSRNKGRPSTHSDQHLLSPPTDPELAHPRPFSHSHSHRNLLRWTTEILVLFSGAVCLTSITLILWRADGNPPPQWPLNTNLNTMIAFLASLAKVTFVMAIVECLGQLKWIWFLSCPRDNNQPRPLIDFQLFEEATKGGWGSWKLLFHFKGWLPSFGALILVSGLLTSTFTQMAVTYPVLQAEAKNGSEVATVERATGFSVYDGANLVPGPFEAVREQQAVYTGGFFPPNEEAPHLPPVCSSGDCVWPAYGSLAVCSSVVNLTAQANLSLLSNLRNVTAKRLAILYTSIKSNGDIYNWTNFQSQALPGFYPVILGPMFSPSSSFNASVQNLILNDNFIAYPTRMLDLSSALDLDAFHFLGLTFWWCAKSYSTSVKAGQHTTVELETRSEVVVPPSSSQETDGDTNKTKTLNMAWSHEFYPCYTSGTCNATFGDLSVSLLPPATANLSQPQPATYDINVWTALTVSGLLAATMWDSVLMDQSHGVVTSNGGGVAKAFALSVLGDFLAPAPDPATQMSSARRVAGNIARSITNLVREEAGNFTLGGEAVVRGTVYTPQAFVEVHWGWICVLSVQLVATGVFLGLTMWTSGRRRMEVLKSSSLASLVALDGETRRGLVGLVGWEGLEERARRTRVRLGRDGEGRIEGLGVVSAREGKGGKVIEEEEEEEEGGEVTVDTRRQGMVFDDYDTVYLGRTDSTTDGGNSLRRLMTDD